MELLRQTHYTQRLAIAFRLGLAMVSSLSLVHVAALLADDDQRLPFELCQPGDDRRIVAEVPVAVQLDEIGEQPLDVVLGSGAVGSAREVDDLPGRATGGWLGARRSGALRALIDGGSHG